MQAIGDWILNIYGKFQRTPVPKYVDELCRMTCKKCEPAIRSVYNGEATFEFQRTANSGCPDVAPPFIWTIDSADGRWLAVRVESTVRARSSSEDLLLLILAGGTCLRNTGCEKLCLSVGKPPTNSETGEFMFLSMSATSPLHKHLYSAEEQKYIANAGLYRANRPVATLQTLPQPVRLQTSGETMVQTAWTAAVSKPRNRLYVVRCMNRYFVDGIGLIVLTYLEFPRTR